MFLGQDLLPFLVLALGAALVVGTGLALLRPRLPTEEGDLARAPVARSITMIVMGMVAAVWALATLAS